MYALAAVLDPDLLHRLARATYAEMRLAGIDAVGEFHYLHHQSDGTPYDDPNAMGEALIAAARDVDVRICLLDTCYTHRRRRPEAVRRRRRRAVGLPGARPRRTVTPASPTS